VKDRLLRLCLRAYPPAVREHDGDALVDLASEAAEGGSSALREAVGLVAGGARARVRRASHELAAAPWHEARARLALPLAAALLAVTLFGAEQTTPGLAWIGWSWALALAGAGCALVGAATGRRGLTAAGAVVLTVMLGLDSVRDLHGAGSRLTALWSSSYVDVLVMWLPAGLLLLGCAGAVERRARPGALARVAWAALPAAVLVILSAERSSANAAQWIVLFGGVALAAALVVLGLALRRRDPALTLTAALVLAAAAIPALWLGAALLPPPSSDAIAVPIAYFAVTGTLMAGAVAGLARLASR
jgi:hypothetical protein